MIKCLFFPPVITGKRSDKLADRWQGPYKVLGKVSPVTYIVNMPERHKRHRTVHVTAMKSLEPTLSILHIHSILRIHSVTPTDHDLPDYRCEPLVDLNALTQTLSSDKQEALKALLHRFPEVMKPEPGHTHLASHRINTEEVLPLALPYYRCLEVWKQPFKEELQYLKENFFIEESTSPWAAPKFAVPKKNGSIRLVVDYRRLNIVTVSDPYSMP